MDNFRIDVTSDGRPSLRLLLQFIFQKKYSPSVVAWGVFPAEKPEDVKDYEDREPRPQRVVFYTSPPPASENAQLLPFPIDADMVADLAIGWIEKTATFGEQDDMDGTIKKGWRVFNESWGHVHGHYSAMFAITPEWSYYGK